MLLPPRAVLAADNPAEILLWPNGAPGSEGKPSPDEVTVQPNGEHVVTNVNKPSITPWLPAAGQATGAAVVIAPGGGHKLLSIDSEGHNVGRWLSAHGVAGFVLKYRLAKAANSTYTVEGDELADLQRAIRLVRSRAADWGVDPHRIGVIGFSAGGELACLSVMHTDDGKPDASDPIDRQSCRADFVALMYPGNSQAFDPPADTPPAFLACGANDRPDISEGLVNVYLKIKKVGSPVELHIYTGLGHGFGLRPATPGPASTWIDRFYEWLGPRGFLKRSRG